MLIKTIALIALSLLPSLFLSMRIEQSTALELFFSDKNYIPGTNARPNWMRRIDDKVPLDLIIIPGTHDSATYCIRDFTAYAVTQSMTIAEQLDAGVRYLDIRLCYSNDSPTSMFICHGLLGCKLTFEEVLFSVRKFLTLNPSEGVILKVMNERRLFMKKIATLVGNLVQQYNKYFLQTSTIPTMGQMRGKILLMPSDISLPSFTYIPWLKSSLFSAQANYVFRSKEEKRRLILNMDSLIAQNTNEGRNPLMFYVNEFSASGIAAGNLFGTTKSIAKEMNGVVTELQGRVGLIIFDYPSQHLISYLIDKYFTYLNKYITKIIKRN